MRAFFKPYFWVLSVFFVAGFVSNMLNDRPFELVDLTTVPGLVALAGVFGVAYNRALGRATLWRIFLLAYAATRAITLSLLGAFPLATWAIQPQVSEFGLFPVLFFMSSLGIAIAFGIALLAFEFYALYVYAFKSPHIWDPTAPAPPPARINHESVCVGAYATAMTFATLLGLFIVTLDRGIAGFATTTWTFEALALVPLWALCFQRRVGQASAWRAFLVLYAVGMVYGYIASWSAEGVSRFPDVDQAEVIMRMLVSGIFVFLPTAFLIDDYARYHRGQRGLPRRLTAAHSPCAPQPLKSTHSHASEGGTP